MEITIEVTPETKMLMAQLGNNNILRQAKINTLKNASQLFINQAKREAPADTGNLRRNIKFDVNQSGEFSTVKAETDYALFQEEGTGIFGPRKTMIIPRRAKVLRFTTKGGGIVFTKKVRGTPGKWFMKKGSEELLRRTSEIASKLYNDIRSALNV